MLKVCLSMLQEHEYIHKSYILSHICKPEYYIYISLILVDGIDMTAFKFREAERQTDLFEVCLAFCDITLNEQ